MIRNYCKIALYQLFRHKLHSTLNIAGLAVGLACCVLMGLFVAQELSYDHHYEHADRIYRIGRSVGNEVSESNSVLAASLLKQDFAAIEEAAGIAYRTAGPILLSRSGQAFFEEEISFADHSFFDLFDLQWLEGDSVNALLQPGGVVLTKSLAQKYFGGESALGQTLLMDNIDTLRVTGIIADMPVTTHLRTAAIVSMDVFEQRYARQGFDIRVWNFVAVDTYILLRRGSDIDAVERGLADFAARHVPEGSTRFTGFTAMPLTAIHLQTDTGDSLGATTRIYIFSSLAFCILLIAVINFMNLSTAQSTGRALEVGLRKTMGATRHQLILQFLGETCLMVLPSLLLAAGLVEMLLPAVNAALGLELSFNVLERRSVLAGFGILFLFLSVLAGAYPAFFLSRFKPAIAVRGRMSGGPATLLFRNALVVLQFTIAITLIVTSIVVFLQMRLARNFDLGYDGQQVLEFSLPPADVFDVNAQWQSFKARMLEYPGIQFMTHSFSSPLLPSRLELELSREGESEPVELVLMLNDADFFQTYDVPQLAGRLLSPEIASDRALRFDPADPDRVLGNVILNESGAGKLGWLPEEAVGETVKRDNGARYRVVGVVGDTLPSVKEGPVGMFFMAQAAFDYSRFGGGNAALRIAGGDLAAALEHVDAVWREFSPDEPIQRHFVDDQVAALYQGEQMQARLFSYAAAFAVVIACFGLLGLAAYSAERRTREIGVRKVLGGSVWSIVVLLTNDFSKLVLISNLLAWPMAYFAMERWLENFAYRIDLAPLIFIGSGLIALCIAWVTVGGTAAKAASAKPVLALRYE